MSLRVDLELSVGDSATLHAALTANPRDTLLITGANGSGKTTLLRALIGLVTPLAGELRRDDVLWSSAEGAVTPSQQRGFGYAPQTPTLFRDRSVLWNVALGARCQGQSTRAATETAHRWGDALGLHALHHQRADRLSGGEAARTSLARALASSPRHLALDEPLAHIGEEARTEIVRVLEKFINEHEGPHFIVTHHPSWFAALHPRILRIERNTIVEDPGDASAA
ncbi:MAG: ATP-binding cassette domain-containing protein [Nannocystaceae bacterium]